MNMPESARREHKMINAQKDIWKTKAYDEKFLRLQREKTYNSEVMLSIALDIPTRFIRITDDFLCKRASFDKLAKDNRLTKTFIRKTITYVLNRYNAACEATDPISEDLAKIKYYIDTAPISFKTETYICKRIQSNPKLTLMEGLTSLNDRAYKVMVKNCQSFDEFKHLSIEKLLTFKNCTAHVANRLISAIEKACADELLDEFVTLYPVPKKNVLTCWMRKTSVDDFTELVIKLKNNIRIIWIKSTQIDNTYDYAIFENVKTITKEELANVAQWSGKKTKGE